eukprot:GEMP01028371.1.p1 GENE.GEMP01028371.1~~GEMP01028371.1.p1  ORF type:complete len:610 (+),score=99.16 GEMP01028371.1:102-1931(+)
MGPSSGSAPTPSAASASFPADEADILTTDTIERLKRDTIAFLSLRDLERTIDANVEANQVAIAELEDLVRQVIMMETKVAKIDRPRPQRSHILHYLVSHVEDMKAEKEKVELWSLHLKLDAQESRVHRREVHEWVYSRILHSNMQFRQDVKKIKEVGRDAICAFSIPEVGPHYFDSLIDEEESSAKRRFRKVQDLNQNMIVLLMREQESLSRMELEDAVDTNWTLHTNVKEFVAGGLLESMEDNLSTGLKLKFSIQTADASRSPLPYSETMAFLIGCRLVLQKVEKYMNQNESWPDRFRGFDEEMQPRTRRESSSQLGESSVGLSALRVLSYNVFMRPPAPRFFNTRWNTHNTDDDYKNQRLERIADRVLDKYDIVCLQEMFGSFSYRRDKLIRKAKQLGFMSVAKSPTNVLTTGFLVDGGLMLLSRYPFIREPDYQTFETRSKFADQLASKGWIYAKIQIGPCEYVHVVVTHLQACYSKTDSTHEIRMKQVDEILTYLRQYARDDPREREPDCPPSIAALPAVTGVSERIWPLLICGDFNVNGRKSPTDGSHSPECSRFNPITGMIGCGGSPWITYSTTRHQLRSWTLSVEKSRTRWCLPRVSSNASK